MRRFLDFDLLQPSVSVAATRLFFQRKMADDFVSVNRNVFVNVRHRHYACMLSSVSLERR